MRKPLYVLPKTNVHVSSFGDEAFPCFLVVQGVLEDDALDFLGLAAEFLLARELDGPAFVAVLLVAPVRLFEKDLVFSFLVRLGHRAFFEVLRRREIQALHVVRTLSRHYSVFKRVNCEKYLVL